MPDRQIAPGVIVLAEKAQTELPQLIDLVCRQIQTEMNFYGGRTIVSDQQLRESVTRHLSSVFEILTGRQVPDLAEPKSTGHNRALQGAPLPEVLRAFRIGFGEVWNLMSEQAASEGMETLQALVTAASSIWSLADDYAEAITTSYRETAANLLLRQQQQRSALVEALLSGSMTHQGSRWEIAQLLQIPVDGTFVVVVAQTPALGNAALPEIEAALLARRFSSAWRLFPDMQVGIVSLGEPADLEDVVQILRGKMSTRIGLSPIYVGLDGTPRGLRLARAALSSIPAHVSDLVSFNHSPLASLVASAPEESRQLIEHVLGPLLDLPAEDRGVLLSTLRTWFAEGGSTKRTAERSYCHPNTIRYRLRRIQDELGRTLTDPGDLADLATALHALATFPEAETER